MDLQLLAALLAGVTTVIVVITKSRLDAFAGLLLGALVTGLVAGVPVAELVTQITEGFGSTLGEIGIVIALGVMIGKVLEETGAAAKLAGLFVRMAGRGREDIALATTGAVVSVPVYCDSGFVILHPLARSLARTARRPVVLLCLALAGGLSVTHHLVPPTPGPLAAAGLLGVNLGKMILAGLLFAVVLLVVVVVYARTMGPRLESQLDPTAVAAGSEDTDEPTDRDDERASGPGTQARPESRAGVMRGITPLLVPLLLIVCNTASEAIAPDSAFTGFTKFIGNPSIALLIGLIIAVYLLPARDTSRETVTGWLGQAAAAAGSIVFITGAGGAFGNVLNESGVGQALAEVVAGWPLPLFLVPFLIATFVRLAQGSGTVAIITAATLSVPLVASGLNPLLGALAACSGSLVFSYYNDSYFWVVTKFTGLSGGAALKMWSGMTTALWAACLPLLGVAALVLA
ncbi:GntP family gluconate:H+ symporter [Halopolyspora algeriensis]|uniref:GntP family gluconate:H+ symporter n=1 Tax=Halopolyspora algeriensis TaxID=1500506 RepID=A0A368VGU1_9ACTN|nr:SLC13 family permease [Halopolyspora algeriensis]RCW40510.1 GntP family gluconate:H+ symporter [Halopolyspora algeriensis]TQM53793.1 GntP family gluconate:H+ symporter [Halopolyspora algeriensis]